MFRNERYKRINDWRHNTSRSESDLMHTGSVPPSRLILARQCYIHIVNQSRPSLGKVRSVYDYAISFWCTVIADKRLWLHTVWPVAVSATGWQQI